MSKTKDHAAGDKSPPTRNAKLDARARARIVELYPTHSMPQIKAELEQNGYLPAGVTISIPVIHRIIKKVKKERAEALEQYKAHVNKTIADQVLPAITSDLVAMDDLAKHVVEIGHQLRAISREGMTLYCETGVPTERADGTLEHPLVLNAEGKPVLRMTRDLMAQIEVRKLQVKALTASAQTYRLGAAIRQLILSTAGLGDEVNGKAVVALPEVTPVPDNPYDDE